MSAYQPVPADPAALETCSYSYVKRALGRQQFGDQRFCTYVNLLIRECGFPRPLPSCVARRLTGEAVPGSVWMRGPVDAWLAAQLPPPAAAAMDEAAMRAAAAEMDSAAGALRVVGGKEA